MSSILLSGKKRSQLFLDSTKNSQCHQYWKFWKLPVFFMLRIWLSSASSVVSIFCPLLSVCLGSWIPFHFREFCIIFEFFYKLK